MIGMKRWKVILTAAVLAIAATACSSEKEEEPVKKVADLEIQIDNEKETDGENETGDENTTDDENEISEEIETE